MSRTRSRKEQALNIGTSHVSARRGTPKETAEYCKKAESRVSGTEPTELGFLQPRIHEVSPAAIYYNYNYNYMKKKKGSSNADLLDNVMCNDIVSRKSMLVGQESGHEGPRSCYVVWGPGGTGKSCMMRSIARIFTTEYGWGEETLYIKDGSQWWQQYNKEKIVMFPTFESTYPLEQFKRLIDKSYLQLPVKGGSISSHIRIILICSNQNPSDWYNGKGATSVTWRVQNIWKLHHIADQDTIQKCIIAKIVHDNKVEQTDKLTNTVTALPLPDIPTSLSDDVDRYPLPPPMPTWSTSTSLPSTSGSSFAIPATSGCSATSPLELLYEKHKNQGLLTLLCKFASKQYGNSLFVSRRTPCANHKYLTYYLNRLTAGECSQCVIKHKAGTNLKVFLQHCSLPALEEKDMSKYYLSYMCMATYGSPYTPGNKFNEIGVVSYEVEQWYLKQCPKTNKITK